MRARGSAALAALVIASGTAWCQEAEEPALAQQSLDAGSDPATLGRGIASWYGLAFHGRLTASGERFNMNALTAAHPWLPFGTLVQVRSLVNGRVVTVRINDRGPHTGGRVIDLSHAAARALGLLSRDTKLVELLPVEASPLPAR